MIRFVGDEDFNNRIFRSLLRLQPDLDIVRIQDVHLSGADDSVVLEWAFREQRVLLTHDVSTTAAYAFERMCNGESIAGLIEVSQSMPIGKAIDDIVTIAVCSTAEEIEN